jgi:hypothetical protein
MYICLNDDMNDQVMTTEIVVLEAGGRHEFLDAERFTVLTDAQLAKLGLARVKANVQDVYGRCRIPVRMKGGTLASAQL